MRSFRPQCHIGVEQHASSVYKFLQSCVLQPQTNVRCVHNYYPQETSQKPFWDVSTHHDVTLGTLPWDFHVPWHGSWLRLGVSNSITSLATMPFHVASKAAACVKAERKVNLCDDDYVLPLVKLLECASTQDGDDAAFIIGSLPLAPVSRTR